MNPGEVRYNAVGEPVRFVSRLTDMQGWLLVDTDAEDNVVIPSNQWVQMSMTRPLKIPRGWSQHVSLHSNVAKSDSEDIWVTARAKDYLVETNQRQISIPREVLEYLDAQREGKLWDGPRSGAR